ncbi:hypothetical protein D3C86_1799900 [compost metagenome]
MEQVIYLWMYVMVLLVLQALMGRYLSMVPMLIVVGIQEATMEISVVIQLRGELILSSLRLSLF